MEHLYSYKSSQSLTDQDIFNFNFSSNSNSTENFIPEKSIPILKTISEPESAVNFVV